MQQTHVLDREKFDTDQEYIDYLQRKINATFEQQYEPLKEKARSNGNGYKKPEAPDVVSPLKVFSVNELLAKEYEPLKWIIPDILPEGLTMFFSRPKVGKSMVALAVSLRLARRICGGIDGDTLYLTLDDTSERRLQSRVRSLLQGVEVEDRLWFTTESLNLDTGLITQLDWWMKDHPATCLMVIDVYGTVKPKRQGDDIFKGDYTALFALRAFAERHRIAIILVHHTNKRQIASDGDWQDGVNGSTGLTAACDTLWTVRRQGESEQLELLAKGRDVIPCALNLSLEDLDAPWKLQGHEGEPDTKTSEQKILDILKGAGEVSPKKIAELADLNINTVKSSLRRMLSKKLIAQTKYGCYQELQSCKKDIVVDDATLADEPAIQGDLQKSCKELQDDDATLRNIPIVKIPKCQRFSCLTSRVEVRMFTPGKPKFWCTEHRGYIDEQGRPI